MKQRVVVTGLGAISPVGNDVATTWRALLEGQSGAGPITKFDAELFSARFACEVKGFDPLLYMDRKVAKRADLYTQYAVHGPEGRQAGRPLHSVRRRGGRSGDG